MASEQPPNRWVIAAAAVLMQICLGAVPAIHIIAVVMLVAVVLPVIALLSKPSEAPRRGMPVMRPAET